MRKLCFAAAAALLILAVTPLKAQSAAPAYPPDSLLRSMGIGRGDVDSLIANGIPSNQVQSSGILSGGHDPNRGDHGGYRHDDRFAWYWFLPFEWREILRWRFEHRYSRTAWHWAPFRGWYCTTEWYWDDGYAGNWGPPPGWQRNWNWNGDRGYDRGRDHDRNDRGGRHNHGDDTGGHNDHGGRHH